MIHSEEEIFTAALALPPGDRADFLARTCGDDAELRARVSALLEAHDGTGVNLEHSPFEVPARNARARPALVGVNYERGMKIGRYKLLQELGEGGCGMVFMAEQEDPVRRRVALKVIKLGMDTREVIARFEAERQALALMDHPNIAHVLDAGATESGRPFFVMELVRGIPITRHCDENHLGPRDRLLLFIQVCSAVQHAHQKGIVHRDLKPSNILVTLHDGVPVPKIIDFGIAKAMHGRLTDKTLFTAFEQFIGTPAYMSPEQTEMSGLDVDTRSDIYSLGVLLYELLTGRTPFESQALAKAGLDELRRAIREKEPAKPSTRFSTLNAAERAEISRRRGVDDARLHSWLRGDVDWIVMRCLEKDRRRRYETANSLATDIQRHLASEPVMARPPSTGYLLRKLIRRNKFAFAAAGAVFVTLVAGLAFSTASYMRERDARQIADLEAVRSAEVARFMQAMLAGVRPQMALGRDTQMLRAILDETVERLNRQLHNQPEVAASLRETLGNVYRDLGELRSAALMHETALGMRREIHGPEHITVAEAMVNYSETLTRQERVAEAEVMLRDALAMQVRLLGPDHDAVAATRAALEHVRLRQRQSPTMRDGDAPANPRSTADLPTVIHIAHSGGRAGGEPFNVGNILRTTQARGDLERQFGTDGIRIEWTVLPSGLATNDVFAGGNVDFAQQGDAAAISGRAIGLDHRLLLALSGNSNGTNYLVVRASSPFHSLADLRGRRLATIRGTNHHLTLCRLLEKQGLAEEDFEIVDPGNGAAVVTSVITGESDATFMNVPFDLQAAGTLRVVDTMARDPDLAGVTVFWVARKFELRYPVIVQRLVTALVTTAAWSSDGVNRTAVLRLWSGSDRSLEAIEKSWAGLPMKEQLSPLMDDCFLTILRRRAGEARRFGLIATDVTIEDWIEPKYLQRALEELGLENYWPERDAKGNPKAAPDL